MGPIAVPHDAMMFEGRDAHTAGGHSSGYFPGGVYSYTKTIRPPEEWLDRSVLVEFEGIFHRSEVRLNGHLIGGRPSGYTLFHVDLTEHLEFGAENILEVVEGAPFRRCRRIRRIRQLRAAERSRRA